MSKHISCEGAQFAALPGSPANIMYVSVYVADAGL